MVSRKARFLWLLVFGLVLPVESRSVIPDLDDPRIMDSGHYKEGGTIAFEVRGRDGTTIMGGFDGRMRRASDCPGPHHMYVGAAYVGDPGARLLDLWGAEEERLLRIVHAALVDTLGAQTLMIFRSGVRPPQIPDSLRRTGLAGLARATEQRLIQLNSIHSGRLRPAEVAAANFGLVLPVRLQSVASENENLVASVVDANGTLLTVEPVGDECTWLYSVGRYGPHTTCGYWSSSSLDLVAVIEVALAEGGEEEHLDREQVARFKARVERCRTLTLDRLRDRPGVEADH